MVNSTTARLRRALRPHLVPAMRAFAVGSPVLAAGVLLLDRLRAREAADTGALAALIFVATLMAALFVADAAVRRWDGARGDGVRKCLASAFYAAVLAALIAFTVHWSRGRMRGDEFAGAIFALTVTPLMHSLRYSVPASASPGSPQGGGGGGTP